MSKKEKNRVKVTILKGCRIDGESRLPGKTYSVSIEGARLACGAGRARYGESAKKPRAKPQSNDAESASNPTDPQSNGTEPKPEGNN